MKTQEYLTSMKETSYHLNTQDNLGTADPMFCLEILVRDVGYDTSFVDNRCWYNHESNEAVYDDDPDFKKPPTGEGWDTWGYKDRWETVMVSFTKNGLDEYMRLDGHNVKGMAFRGKTRIYVKSFRRCPEMIAIREHLLNN